MWGNPRHRAGILSSNSPDPLRCSQSGGILAGGLGIACPGDCCRGSVGEVPESFRSGPPIMNHTAGGLSSNPPERVTGERGGNARARVRA